MEANQLQEGHNLYPSNYQLFVCIFSAKSNISIVQERNDIRRHIHSDKTEGDILYNGLQKLKPSSLLLTKHYRSVTSKKIVQGFPDIFRYRIRNYYKNLEISNKKNYPQNTHTVLFHHAGFFNFAVLPLYQN